MKNHSKRGFTLIEILVVIAIIGLLAAILVPVAGAAMTSVKRTTMKSKYTSWITAVENYKQQYQSYPILEKGGSVSDDQHYDLGTGGASLAFVKSLSGRDPDTGETLTNEDRKSFNRRAIGFYDFTDEDFTQEDGTIERGTLSDSFGNRHIHIVMDTDGNKRVVIPQEYLPDDPTDAETDANGLLRTVIIFSTQKDGEDYENIYSWR